MPQVERSARAASVLIHVVLSLVGSRRRFATALQVCALLGAARVAHADVAAVRKTLWVRPGATCLNAARLATQVDRLLDDEPSQDGSLFVVEGSASDARTAQLQVVRE